MRWEPVRSVRITGREDRLLQLYRSLPDDFQDALRSLVEYVLKKYRAQPPSSAKPRAKIIPIIR
jgi:hypothetical protein